MYNMMQKQAFFNCYLLTLSLLRLNSVSDKWMNENRAVMEWYDGTNEILGENPTPV
jgi:hypothetical protein